MSRVTAPALLGLAALVGTSAVRAETLSLDEAVRIAATKSPRIDEAQADVDGARASVSFARSGYLPEANLAAAGTLGFGGSTTGAMGVRGIMGSPNAQHFGAGIEGAWTVCDFGRTSSRVDAALAGVDSATARQRLSERLAALEVIRAFGAVTLSEEDLRSTAAIIELRVRGAEAARALSAAGARPETDALIAEARAGEAKATLEVLRADLDAARGRLGAILGRAITESTALTMKEPARVEVDRAERIPPPRDPLHDVARAEAARAEALDRAAAAEHLPKLVVAGSAGYARREAPDDPGYWAAGVGVVVPLFTFAREGARAREAAAAARAAGARASQADIEQKAQIGTEIAALRALAASVAAADSSTAAAKAALDAAEARYAAGQLSFADVDAARDAFVRIASTRRRVGVQGALALARLRVWSTQVGDRRADAR